MSEGNDSGSVARLIGNGFLTDKRAQEIQSMFPQVSDSLVQWIRDSAATRDWRRVERFANLAAAVRAPGLGSVLCEILAADPYGLNKEDLVEILGEVGAVDCAPVIIQLVKDSLASDAPAYWLCQKAILALADLGTEESRRFLSSMTADSWPNPIRWHAAVALNVEDELGFDEDEMPA